MCVKMRSNPNILLVIFICFSFFTSITPCCNNNDNPKEHQNPKIKGMFVFGSSLVDNGNNNIFNSSIAKANYSPYGVDFSCGPSGRYTNGKNVIDLIGEKLHLPNFIPPFTDPSTKGSRIVHGVNFASGGSGILDNTGSLAGRVISLNEQIRNLEYVTIPELKKQLGCNNSSTSILSNYLFVVGSGGNDYLFNYFLTPGSKNNVTLKAFTSTLITTLSYQLKKLYNLGARKFVIIGVNPNGCSPMVKAKDPSQKGCIESVNKASQLFNSNLRNLVDCIKLHDMPESHLVFFDSYKVIMDIIHFPTSLGFEDTSRACCEVKSEDGGILCKKDGSICPNRSNHVFFDGLHPTEAVNIVLANKAYASHCISNVYPMNIHQLVQLC